jgi:hypothetical protein
MRIFLISMMISLASHAAQDYGYLKPEDQKYFKNDAFDGQNKWERIDLNVKEINKLHGEIAALKAEMASLKEEIEKLKKK